MKKAFYANCSYYKSDIFMHKVKVYNTNIGPDIKKIFRLDYPKDVETNEYMLVLEENLFDTKLEALKFLSKKILNKIEILESRC
jgi:hypothetical protein